MYFNLTDEIRKFVHKKAVKSNKILFIVQKYKTLEAFN